MKTIELLDRLHAYDAELAAELERALRDDVVALELSPGRGTAGDLHATLLIRDATSTAGGASKAGFAKTLGSLASLPAATNVLLYHLRGDDRLFTVFARADTAAVIGAIRITNR